MTLLLTSHFAGSSLPFLEVLDLSSNNFSGALPVLGQAGSSLLTLDLSSNSLTGALLGHNCII